MKPMFIRTLAFILSAGLLVPAGYTQEDPAPSAGRRRAVRTVDPNAVILVGTITDAATGAPIFDALVRVSHRWGLAGRKGTYRVSRLASGGYTATITRWGYNTETRNVALVPGTNTLNATMTSKPKITLTTTSGEVNYLDYENSEFVDVYPFLGLSTISPINVCTFTGSKSSTIKENLKLITFTDQRVTSTNCCADPTRARVANITLRSGARFDAIITNSCTAYSMGFHGGNHATGDFTNYPLGQISKIEFP